jgi:hypothetical protein
MEECDVSVRGLDRNSMVGNDSEEKLETTAWRNRLQKKT